MTRPQIDISPTRHGAMKQFGDKHGLSPTETYTLAVELLIYLDPESEFDPTLDEWIAELLATRARRGDFSKLNSGDASENDGD